MRGQRHASATGTVALEFGKDGDAKADYALVSACMPLKIAYVVMKYPTLTQTFVEREMLGLAAQGLEVEVHPCFDFRRLGAAEPATPGALRVARLGSAWQFAAAAGLGTVRELVRRPGLVLRGLRLFALHAGLHWEGWFMTVWGMLFALARAGEFRRRGIEVVHGAWATAPATAAAVLSELCGIPFSFGAHAYDLHRHGGDPLLGPKMRSARFVHTTTQANADDLAMRFPKRRAEIVLARRGLGSLPEQRAQAAILPGSTGWRLLSVGRLVEKKGHEFQIEACIELARRGLPFQLRIIGEGPLHNQLAAAISRARLQHRIVLAGACSPAEVEAAYAEADIFWHTGIVDSLGDRDGLPNVIPEALAHSLPGDFKRSRWCRRGGPRRRNRVDRGSQGYSCACGRCLPPGRRCGVASESGRARPPLGGTKFPRGEKRAAARGSLPPGSR